MLTFDNCGVVLNGLHCTLFPFKIAEQQWVFSSWNQITNNLKIQLDFYCMSLFSPQCGKIEVLEEVAGQFIKVSKIFTILMTDAVVKVLENLANVEFVHFLFSQLVFTLLLSGADGCVYSCKGVSSSKNIFSSKLSIVWGQAGHKVKLGHSTSADINHHTSSNFGPYLRCFDCFHCKTTLQPFLTRVNFPPLLDRKKVRGVSHSSGLGWNGVLQLYAVSPVG